MAERDLKDHEIDTTLDIITCIILALIAITTAASAATVTGISPESAAVDETLTTVHVSGTGFTTGVQVSIRSGHTWIDATDETRINSTTVTCTLIVPWDAVPGLYDVYVTGPGGTWVYTIAAFQVV